jgi:16S rRNA (guanine966-N2)-methyltransferase
MQIRCQIGVPLQIIAGKYKGLKLTAPKGMLTRPTSARVREALFSKWAPLLEGSHFLDLFAGSGLIGFEAASRGAQLVVMVEQNPAALRVLRDNAELIRKRATECPPDLQLVGNPVSQSLLQGFAAASRRFHLMWADPPYAEAEKWLPDLLAHLPNLAAPEARFVMEVPRSLSLSVALPKGWEFLRENLFGDTKLIDFAWTGA